MNQAYWRQRWQEHRIGFHRPDVHPRLPAFWDRLQVAQGGTVFVPLCGKSLDLLWLVEQGYRVRGVELSPIAVQEFFQEHHLHPQVDSVGAFQRWQAGPVEIFCGDFFDLTIAELKDIAAVYDRAALIALPPELRRAYTEKLRDILPHRPPILLITLDYPQETRQGPPFAVPEAEVCALYQPSWAVQHLSSIDLREEGSTDTNRFEELVFVLRRGVDS
ncbi:thiopurine S-methyltransferase [Acidithiobacillus thiooxidans]|uniref:thiopurine S-methyltransferase n=1 Tax=Acidithiobacillus thiooxidans TaxID=930 RepID=UPI001C06BB55|nr:thiopurine S-methyltransferase [Acidithiobacillus thiooxidans]MBU2838833.1 thiopurine S-methyltransferase [Acidithiobacillus thiooxidans]